MSDLVQKYISRVFKDESLGVKPVYSKEFQPAAGRYAPLRSSSGLLQRTLADMGINELYEHQVQAIDLVRSGQNIVTATPTASGKSLIYNLCVLEAVLNDPDTRALYLFPLKALTQDQNQFIQEMAFRLKEEGAEISSAVYDGDTDSGLRKMIRRDPPHILLTNPDMLHRSLLPYHSSWKKFFSGLKYVVVDEVHAYRGIMGSNMAWVFRRLKRICSYYGREPAFIFSSATINNPEELTEMLTGMETRSVTRGTAPQGAKKFILADPMAQGAALAATRLLKSALDMGLRTIVYTQSRKMTELISMWCSERDAKHRDRICAYRAGFLPEQRRRIEARLVSGELLAVVSTSALELGIDVGHLDLCLMVGYPGSVMAAWQRAGRVGRSCRHSAVILIGHEDALDQYYLRNPEHFFAARPERAVINPFNPSIMSRHLVCAASDLPLRPAESFMEERLNKCLEHLENKGLLISSQARDYYYTREKYPQGLVDLRGSGKNYGIFNHETGEFLGEIDGKRVFHDTHPGAVYLHQGGTYQVQDLDIEALSVFVAQTEVKYYTRPLTHKVTEIIETEASSPTGAGEVFFGRLKVTEQVVGYEKILIKGHKKIGMVPLDLPPSIMETQGMWLTISPEVQKSMENRMLHFMGGLHALEHCLIGVLPMLVLTDRNDLGGISTPVHQDLKKGAVFIYDGFPGGIGLSRQAYSIFRGLLEKGRQVVSTCQCGNGCPACIHSPKCGSGNRPLDKEAALVLLEAMLSGNSRSGTVLQKKSSSVQPVLKKEVKAASRKFSDYAVLDIETRKSAAEVGGWGNSHLMGVSCSVVYDSISRDFRTFYQEETDSLGEYLSRFGVVIGFNVVRFDYQVLKGQSDFDFAALPTLDVLLEIQKRLGHRLSLNHLAGYTLGTEKTADGLLALKWWKQGRIEDIVKYCMDDVAITRDLFHYGLKNGHLVYRNKAGSRVRIPVDWPDRYTGRDF